ncbi:receptor-type tyrosine-protein phosphatase F [Biomphalaria glabrata]
MLIMSESLTALPVCTALLLFVWVPLTEASDIFQSVGIKVDTSAQVTVNWTLYPELEPEPMNITLWSKLLGQGDCSNQTGPSLLVGTSALHKGVFVIRNLKGWTRYNISIEGNNSNKYYNQLLTSEVITQEDSAPTGQVTQFSVSSLKSYHAVLSWQPPECAQRKGELSSYELLVTRTDSVNSNTTLSWPTNATTYTLRDLYPSTSYIVLVTYVNSIGKGPYSQINFTTLSNSLPAVEIATMTMTYSTATLTFEPFDSSLGITSLTLAYSQFQDFNSSEFIKITNLKNSPAILNQLSPDTVYYIKAAAVSGDDVGPYGSVAQVRTLKLIDLTLVSRTRNCFFLAWMLPSDVLMSVTNFTLTVTSLTYGLNYQLILDQSTYLKAVCELRPSTLYNVTIVANNNNRVVSLATANFSTDIALPTTPLTPVLVRSTNATVTIAIEPLKVTDAPVSSYQIVVQPRSSKDSYVCAEFTSNEMTNKTHFLVGERQMVGGYFNQALIPNVYYLIFLSAKFLLYNITSTNTSLPLEVYTELFDPQVAMSTSLALTSRNTTCINVSWSVPREFEKVITELKLNFAESNKSGPGISPGITVTMTTHFWCGLTPSTTYNIDLSVMTRNGVLARVVHDFSTVPVSPPSPVSPVLVNSSYTNITMIIAPVLLEDTRSTNEYYVVVDEVSDKGDSARHKRDADAHALPGNITARLFTRQLRDRVYFVVGNGKLYGGYFNAPLRPHSFYLLYFGVCSSYGGYTKCSYTTVGQAVQAVPRVFTGSNSKQEDGNPAGIIIGCLFLLLFILAVIALVVYTRHRMGAVAVFLYFSRTKTHDASVGYRSKRSEYVNSEDDHPKEADYNVEDCWTSIYNYQQCRRIEVKKSRVEIVKKDADNFSNITETKIISFADEFQHLRSKPEGATDKTARQFPSLNRSKNLLPFDHSLVRLKSDLCSSNAFINASFVPGYRKTPAYIAAQSPFNETTVLDFWRLIYQRGIKTVVMMTNLEENDVTMCFQYWPNGQQSDHIGMFQLCVTHTTEYTHYTVIVVQVRTQNETDPRIVQIFQFTSWPLCGVPDDPLPLLEMRQSIKRHHREDTTPILVHCGTGVGRSGVFIAVDALIEQYEAEGGVQVFDFIRAIRKDRNGIVRTFSQYVFIYDALLQFFLASVDKADTEEKRSPMFATSQCYLQEQYTLMRRFTRRKRTIGLSLEGIKYTQGLNKHGDPMLTFQTSDESESTSDFNLSLDKVKPNAKPFFPAIESIQIHNPRTGHCEIILGDIKTQKYVVIDNSSSNNDHQVFQFLLDNTIRTVISLGDNSFYNSERVVDLGQGRTILISTSISSAQFAMSDLKIGPGGHSNIAGADRIRVFHKINTPKDLGSQTADLVARLLADVVNWQNANSDVSQVLVQGETNLSAELVVMLLIICKKAAVDEEVDVYRTIKYYNRYYQLVKNCVSTTMNTFVHLDIRL